jgi:hypothetical protein
MTSEKKNQIWTIDELVQLTDTVQKGTVEYNGKEVPLQWCELTEAEEPKMVMPDESASEEEKTAHFSKLATMRVVNMVEKANKMDKDSTFITEENWAKFPSTLRWRISNKILQSEETKSDF